MSTRRQ